MFKCMAPLYNGWRGSDMDSPTQRWQCRNGCNTFECLGTPTYCPYCGTAEVYATDNNSDS